MIKGKKVLLRTIREKEMEVVYNLICSINNKGPYWHLIIPSEAEFKREFSETGLWGKREGRMLIMDINDTKYLGEILFFKVLSISPGSRLDTSFFIHPMPVKAI